MNRHLISREETQSFSQLANQLVYQQNELSHFIQQPFSEKELYVQMDRKKKAYSSESRATLVQEIKKAYASVKVDKAVTDNIELLTSEDTFTVTTGHQLSLLTGPLYFILKIQHVIELAKRLNQKGEKKVVPVFWMATEDHDLEEIQSIHLFNKQITWEREAQGAVGRMSTEKLDEFKSEIQQFFGNHEGSEVWQALDAYQGKNLSEATFNLVNHLFGKEGLVILDADNPELKKALRPVLERELNEHASQKAVQERTEELEKAGYHGQAHAREINFFYLGENYRERLKEEGDAIVIDQKGQYSKEEVMQLFDENPASFSPNVILRPMYQEMILPNICYVGGGGEIAYWLQLKGVFDVNNVLFPLIQMRNSLAILDDTTKKKMELANWDLKDLFSDVDQAKKDFVMKQSSDLDISPVRLKQEEIAFEIMEAITKVDAALHDFGKAEIARISKQIDTLEQKLIRAEKGKHEKVLKAMDQVKDRLFPGGTMMERKVNFFQLCADGQVFAHLQKLQEAIDPFENDFIILEWS